MQHLDAVHAGLDPLGAVRGVSAGLVRHPIDAVRAGLDPPVPDVE